MDLCRLEPNLNETLPKMAAWSTDVTQKMSRGRISFLPQAQAPRGLKGAWMHNKHCSIFGPRVKFQRIHFKYRSWVSQVILNSFPSPRVFKAMHCEIKLIDGSKLQKKIRIWWEKCNLCKYLFLKLLLQFYTGIGIKNFFKLWIIVKRHSKAPVLICSSCAWFWKD